MDQASRDAIEAAELSAQLDSIADQIDTPRSYEKAFAMAVLREVNDISDTINEILIAISTASSLVEVKSSVAAIVKRPTRTRAQVRGVLRGDLNNG